MGCIEFFSKEP